MLPAVLSADLCSLLGGVDRSADASWFLLGVLSRSFAFQTEQKPPSRNGG